MPHSRPKTVPKASGLGSEPPTSGTALEEKQQIGQIRIFFPIGDVPRAFPQSPKHVGRRVLDRPRSSPSVPKCENTILLVSYSSPTLPRNTLRCPVPTQSSSG